MTEVAPESDQRRAALVLSSLLLVSGVLVGLSPLLGVVITADSSSTTAPVAAAFVGLSPGLLAVALAVRRPILGLAATAGGGVVGLIQLLTDLAVLTEADRVTRPELFAETTDRARPFTAGAGTWLLLAADVLWLVVGILAATKLAAVLSTTAGPRPDDIFGELDPPGRGPESAAGDDGAEVAAALSRPALGRRPLNLPMVLVGFLGAVLLSVGALATPYSGGYLDLRILPFGSSLTGLVAAALLGFLAAVVVVVAAVLPRSIGQALLAGTAVAAAVPGVTAVVAVLAGAPTSLSPVVWWGLAGAVILGAAGLLARSEATLEPTRDRDVAPPRHWLTIGTGVLALLAGAALVGASRSALLYLDGVAPDEIAGGALAPAGPPLFVAAIPLAIAGAITLIRPVAPLGRAAVPVLSAGAVFAFGQALWAGSLVLATAGDSSTNRHSWTVGPGQWLSLLGTMLALAAAVLATVTSRRAAQACIDVVDDDTLDASRSARRWPAVALVVLIVLALALPVRSDLTGAAPTLLHGYDLDTWGFWALAVGSVGGVWAAALTRRAGPAGAWLVCAAAVVAQPLIVPATIRSAPGFAWSAGFWVGIVVTVLLLTAAPYFAGLAGRVRSSEPPPLGDVGRQPLPFVDVADGPRGTSRARVESKGR